MFGVRWWGIVRLHHCCDSRCPGHTHISPLPTWKGGRQEEWCGGGVECRWWGVVVEEGGDC